jgi:membrane fusion protein
MRKLAEDRDRARIRAAALRQELAHSTGNQQVITAPCRGTVLGLRVRAPGAVVQDGDFVAEVACADQRMQAELQLPSAGVDRVRPGQAVKLLYDAFPYQRFGVRHGRVRWVSPAASVRSAAPSAAALTSAPDESAAAFRALVDVDEHSIRVEGHPRPLLAGMGGEARVVVARRTLVSYAFEPLRELRESLAGGDE